MNITCPDCKSQNVYFNYSDNWGEHFRCYDCRNEWAQKPIDSPKNSTNQSKCLTDQEKKVWRKHFKLLPNGIRTKLFTKLMNENEGIVTNEGTYKMVDGVIIKMKNKII